MSYALIVVYGIITMALGIGPAIAIAAKKYGLKRSAWFSWLLGGSFWVLALLARYPLLIYISSSPELAPYSLFLACLFAGVFETTFRVLLLYFLTRFTATSTEKLVMAGLGWGTVEAFLLHTIPVFSLVFITQDEATFIILEGLEWTLLFGGIERNIAELFHLIMLILVFYGIKDRLKEIDHSEPLAKSFFARDPKPAWVWVIIVMVLHFFLDFFFIILLLYTVDVILMYMLMSVFVGILYVYLSNRLKFYPLFLEKEKKSPERTLKG